MGDEVDMDLLDRLIAFSEAIYGEPEIDLIRLKDPRYRYNPDYVDGYRLWTEHFEGAIKFIGKYILKDVLTLGWIDRGITFNETTGEMWPEDVESILSDALRTAGLSTQG